MKKDICFMALGGGQNVGASCYYLRLGEANIILDCGIGYNDNVVFEPNVRSLLSSPFIESLSQIDQIFISHAHMDHVGYLPKLAGNYTVGKMYMTSLTAVLAEYQLYDKNYVCTKHNRNVENERLVMKHLLDSIVHVSYNKSIDFGRYKVTFYPAGHIPGAAMILFEYGRKRILYTGDYSIAPSPLTNGCMLPEGINPDIVIICGLHAKHSNYCKHDGRLARTLKDIENYLHRGNSVYCQVSQLSKGIEFLRMINIYNEQQGNKYNIYLDDVVMNIVNKLETLSVPLLTPKNYSLSNLMRPRNCIVIGYGDYSYDYGMERIKVDFSLHENFFEMAGFIKKLNPKQAVVVHCAPGNDDYSIEQYLMNDAYCRTQFIFADNTEIYYL